MIKLWLACESHGQDGWILFDYIDLQGATATKEKNAISTTSGLGTCCWMKICGSPSGVRSSLVLICLVVCVCVYT